MIHNLLKNRKFVFWTDVLIFAAVLGYNYVYGTGDYDLMFFQVIIAALAAAASSAATAGIISGTTAGLATVFAATFVVSVAFGALALSLSSKKRNSFDRQSAGALDTTVDPDTPHKIIYGRRRVGSNIIFRHDSGNRLYYHIVMAVAGHEIESYETTFLGNDQLILESEGFDSNGVERFGVKGGRYHGLVRLKFYTGTDSQPADADLIADLPDKWDSTAQGKGIAYVYARLTHDAASWNSRPDFNFEIKGAKVFNADTSVTEYSENPIWINRDFHTNTKYGKGLAASKINDTVAIAEAAIADESVTVDEEFINAFPTQINSFSHVTGNVPENLSYLEKATRWVGDNVVDQYLELVFSESKKIRTLHITSADQTFGNESAPNGWVLKASDTGSFSGEEDTLDTVTNQSWFGGETKTFTFANASTYKYYRLFMSDGTSLSPTLSHIQAEESFTSEARYTCNAVFSTEQNYKSIVDDIVTTCAGKITWSAGQYHFLVGKYRTPTLTLSEGDMIGSISVRAARSGRDIFNTCKGMYPDRGSNYVPTDFQRVINSAAVTKDKRTIIRDLELSNVTSHATAQRLAKIALETNRRPQLAGIICKMTAFTAQVGDTIKVNFAEYGWVEKEFEVLTWDFYHVELEETPFPMLRLALQETDSGVYTWVAENNPVARAAPTFLPDPFSNPSKVENIVAVSGKDNLIRNPTTGDVISRIKVSFDPVNDPRVLNGGKIEIFTKLTNTVTVDDQIHLPETVSRLREVIGGDKTEAFILDVLDGGIYEISMRTSTGSREVKGELTTITHTVTGKDSPPDNVENFAVYNVGTLIGSNWDAVADVDLKGYEIRYGRENEVTWENATLVAKTKQGTEMTTLTVPPGTWSFLIKAFDTSGNESEIASVVAGVFVANVNTVLEEVADGNFPGTLDGFYLHHTSKLVPQGTDDPTSNDFNLFDNFVYLPVARARYTSTEADLGSDKTVRVWGEVLSKLGFGESGTANPLFEIKFRSDGEPATEATSTTNIINECGTFVGCYLHTSGSVVPLGTDDPTSNDFNLFDNFVYLPVAVSSFEAKEQDFMSDINATVTPLPTLKLGFGTSGSISSDPLVDFRTSAGSYDGFETFVGGRRINFRFIKTKIEWNNAANVPYLSSLSLEVDSWQPWRNGNVNNVRYIQARITENTATGVYHVDDFNWTIDQE